ACRRGPTEGGAGPAREKVGWGRGRALLGGRKGGPIARPGGRAPGSPRRCRPSRRRARTRPLVRGRRPCRADCGRGGTLSPAAPHKKKPSPPSLSPCAPPSRFIMGVLDARPPAELPAPPTPCGTMSDQTPPELPG